jgi:predicted Zn-dependent protease
MRRECIAALAGAVLLAGCGGAVHQLPKVAPANLSLAATEVQGAAGTPQRRAVSDEEVGEAIVGAVTRIRPAALQLCHEMRVGTCDWRIRISRDRSLNASAGGNGIIVVNRGIVEFATGDEEIMLVVAHEIGHHAANHVATAQRNKAIGALVGAVLLGAVGVVAGGTGPMAGDLVRQATQTGSDIGGAIGRISFSKEQEREADYLAALILYRSNVDLDKARPFLVTMARSSGRKETGMLDSHPAGPERLAAWDQAVAEIRASNGALPKRAP